ARGAAARLLGRVPAAPRRGRVLAGPHRAAARPLPLHPRGRGLAHRAPGAMSGEPALEAVLETTLYCDASEREETERFYAEALGLRRVAGWPSGTAFRIGAGVLLLFEREGLAA